MKKMLFMSVLQGATWTKLGAVLTTLGILGSGVYFVDDRYEHKISAEQRHMDTQSEFKKSGIRDYEREKFQLRYASSQRKLSQIELERLAFVETELARLNKELTLLQKQLTP